jgi:hypothetical protein
MTQVKVDKGLVRCLDLKQLPFSAYQVKALLEYTYTLSIDTFFYSHDTHVHYITYSGYFKLHTTIRSTLVSTFPQSS